MLLSITQPRSQCLLSSRNEVVYRHYKITVSPEAKSIPFRLLRNWTKKKKKYKNKINNLEKCFKKQDYLVFIRGNDQNVKFKINCRFSQSHIPGHQTLIVLCPLQGIFSRYLHDPFFLPAHCYYRSIYYERVLVLWVPARRCLVPMRTRATWRHTCMTSKTINE